MQCIGQLLTNLAKPIAEIEPMQWLIHMQQVVHILSFIRETQQGKNITPTQHIFPLHSSQFVRMKKSLTFCTQHIVPTAIYFRFIY